MSLFPATAQAQSIIADMGSVLKLIGDALNVVKAVELTFALVDLQNCFSQPMELYQLKEDGSFTTQISRVAAKDALVLIHGTQELNAGSCKKPYETTWKDTSGSKFLNRFLEDNDLKSKFQVFSVHYNSLLPIYITNGPELARLLRNKLPQTPVVVLAHSMGGLIARAALSPPPPFDREGAADIRGLVTLATPHEGVPLASREAAEVLKALRPAALSAVVLAGLGKQVELTLFLTGVLSLTVDGPSRGLRDAAFDSVGFTDYDGNPGNPELASLRQRETAKQLHARQIAFAGKLDSFDTVDAIFRDLNFGLETDFIVPVTSARFTRVSAQGDIFQAVNHISILDMRANPSVFAAVKSALLGFLPLPPPPPPTLTVDKQGTGTGTVTSSIGGINCGTVCISQPINSGDSVVLTAAPGNGSTFSGWSGGGCSATGTCIVTMTANQNVTAIFNLVSPPQEPSTSIVYQPGNDIGVQDIWTTSIYSYATGGGGPGGGLNNELLRVGGFGDLYYSLIKFDLSQLPTVASKAELQLYMPQVTGNGTTGLYLDRITTFWDWRTQGTGSDRDRLWWADRPATVQWISNTLPAPTAGQWYVIDITTLYNAWQARTYPNYGVQLRPVTNSNTWDEFNSSNSSDALHRPRLVVTPPATTPIPTPLPPGYIVQGGLTWMPATFTRNWANANAYCTNTTINGQTGWRLPTQAELESLSSSYGPSGGFNNRWWTERHIWSSTPESMGHYFIDILVGFGWGVWDVNLFGVTCVHN